MPDPGSAPAAGGVNISALEEHMSEPTMWGMHGGLTGNADHVFLKRNQVAIGWDKLGDLSKIPSDREAFKAAVQKQYPNFKPGAVPVCAGQLMRFVHEMREGDWVVYPSRQTRQVHIGRIAGPYRYDATAESTYPNRRAVEWLKALPRTHFTQGALYEIGSAMSLFQIKTYADEFRSAVEGAPPAPPPEQDLTVAGVSEDIEQTTRDFILKNLAQELKGHPLEHFFAHLLTTMGYRTRVAEPGADGGIDIIAHRDELGFEPPRIKVQVKAGEGSVGDPAVSALYGKVGAGEFGLLVTLGTFTTQARHFAREKPNLRLIDGDELVDLVLAHYDQFDSTYKGLLPLKRVYVPQPHVEALSEPEGA